jgi:hypothetical protein
MGMGFHFLQKTCLNTFVVSGFTYGGKHLLDVTGSNGGVCLFTKRKKKKKKKEKISSHGILYTSVKDFGGFLCIK